MQVVRRAIPSAILRAPAHSLWLVPTENSVELYLREDEFMAARYPQRCSMDAQLGIWDLEDVLCLVLLVRLAATDATTFDRRINVASPTGLRLVQLLAVQPTLELAMVTNRIVRSFRRPNMLLDKAVEIIAQVRKRQMWTDAQFDAKAKQLDRLYPTSAALWWAVKRQDEEA